MELWIDADDTLWENNVYFERAFAEFADYLSHSRYSHAEVRDLLDEIEHVNNRIHGYGSANFARNLEQCFERHSERGINEEDRARIRQLGHDLFHHPLELIDDVEETLSYLATRHRLMLCTKGNPAEQESKVKRSGLARHFRHIRVVKEKDVACYRALAAERGIAAHQECWMIGNSPKSDINPALEAGLGAVYIPHRHTWHLEHEPVPESHERLLVLQSFAELRRHF
jgi:putative hydrolase of the HAD superfamily